MASPDHRLGKGKKRIRISQWIPVEHLTSTGGSKTKWKYSIRTVGPDAEVDLVLECVRFEGLRDAQNRILAATRTVSEDLLGANRQNFTIPEGPGAHWTRWKLDEHQQRTSAGQHHESQPFGWRLSGWTTWRYRIAGR